MPARKHIDALIAAIGARNGFSVTVGNLETLRAEVESEIADAFAQGREAGRAEAQAYHAGAGDDEGVAA